MQGSALPGAVATGMCQSPRAYRKLSVPVANIARDGFPISPIQIRNLTRLESHVRISVCGLAFEDDDRNGRAVGVGKAQMDPLGSERVASLLRFPGDDKDRRVAILPVHCYILP